MSPEARSEHPSGQFTPEQLDRLDSGTEYFRRITEDFKHGESGVAVMNVPTEEGSVPLEIWALGRNSYDRNAPWQIKLVVDKEPFMLFYPAPGDIQRKYTLLNLTTKQDATKDESDFIAYAAGLVGEQYQEQLVQEAEERATKEAEKQLRRQNNRLRKFGRRILGRPQ